MTHAVNISGRDGHVINALIMMLHKQLTQLVGDILLNKIIFRLYYINNLLSNLKQHYIKTIHLKYVYQIKILFKVDFLIINWFQIIGCVGCSKL